MRIACCLVLAAAVAFLGCGGGAVTETASERPPPEPREVWVSLNNFEGPEHVGLLMARANGYFDEAGLIVRLGSPTNPSRTTRYVLGGNSDLGVTHMPQAAITQAKGKSILAVGSLISQPTAAMIWLRGSGISRVSDLRGMTIAIPGVPFQKALLKSVLAAAGLTLSDIELKPVSYASVQVLADGRADAIFGVSGNVEGEELRALGLRPVVTPVEELGVPPYDELVVFGRSDFVAKNPRLIRDFLAAASRGTAAAIRNPRRAVEVVQNGIEPNPDSTRKGLRLGVEATLPLLSESGYMDPGQAEDLVAWMRAEGMIEGEPGDAGLISNEYLPRP